LRKAGLDVVQQHGMTFIFDTIGEYIVDLLVDNVLMFELKTVRALDAIHVAQRLNYLKLKGSEG
jgi:GxxExxY protein